MWKKTWNKFVEGEQWEGYLSASSSILGTTAGDELCVVVLEEVFVEGHMFFFCEYGIVGLDTVFFE